MLFLRPQTLRVRCGRSEHLKCGTEDRMRQRVGVPRADLTEIDTRTLELRASVTPAVSYTPFNYYTETRVTRCYVIHALRDICGKSSGMLTYSACYAIHTIQCWRHLECRVHQSLTSHPLSTLYDVKSVLKQQRTRRLRQGRYLLVRFRPPSPDRPTAKTALVHVPRHGTIAPTLRVSTAAQAKALQ